MWIVSRPCMIAQPRIMCCRKGQSASWSSCCNHSCTYSNTSILCQFFLGYTWRQTSVLGSTPRQECFQASCPRSAYILRRVLIVLFILVMHFNRKFAFNREYSTTLPILNVAHVRQFAWLFQYKRIAICILLANPCLFNNRIQCACACPLDSSCV